jgi:aryl-alcohol dehydrogenase-like predicted oxidoreductase
VKEALANGRLADPPAAPAALTALARRHGASLDALAIAAAIAQPWADVVLSGAATVAQLASNVAALDVRLGAEDLDELATIAEPATGYWADRSRLPWR